MFHRALASMTVAFGLTVAGCSDDHETSTAANAATQALFAIGATQYTADGTASYLALAPDLSTQTSVDAANALALPGRGRIWSSALSPHVLFAVDDASATVTKYALDASAMLSAQGTLGLAQYDIPAFSSDAPPRIDVIDAHKAYLLDPVRARAVVFDPETMTGSSVLDLGGLVRDDQHLVLGESSTLLHAGKLIVFGAYVDSDAQRFSSELNIAQIDVETDDVSYLDDTRCSASVAVQTSAGDIYFASGGRAAAYWRVRPDDNPTPCMLRLAANATGLDEFQVALSDLTDGSSSGGLVPADDDAAYVLSFDEALMPITEATLGEDVYDAPAWRWWRVELGQSTRGTRAESPISTTGSAIWHTVDDRTYANDTTANNSSTTLLQTDTGADPEPSASAGGVVLNVVRMR